MGYCSFLMLDSWQIMVNILCQYKTERQFCEKNEPILTVTNKCFSILSSRKVKKRTASGGVELKWIFNFVFCFSEMTTAFRACQAIGVLELDNFPYFRNGIDFGWKRHKYRIISWFTSLNMNSTLSLSLSFAHKPTTLHNFGLIHRLQLNVCTWLIFI